MKKVGILGGAFNPIHNTHIMLALQAYEQLNLDKVILMPLRKPPHKSSEELAEDFHRVKMIEIAIEEYPMLELSDFELKKDGLSYTSETLTTLTRLHPDTQYYFIIGGDSLDNFENWHEPETILRKAVLCCAGRGSEETSEALSKIKYLTEKFTCKDFIPRIHYVELPKSDISSSSLRSMIACGIAVNGLIPGNVIDYIYENDLYVNEKYESILNDLTEKLSPHRLKHTIGVAVTAYNLARIYNESCDKAYLSGLLHDAAKYLSDEEILAESEKLGIKGEPADYFTPSNMLHGKVASEWADIIYGVDDPEIKEAIYYHTTGKPGMSKLAQILFVSDYIEPGREMDCTIPLELIRSIASYDLDLAAYYILKNTYEYLVANMDPQSISHVTKDTYDYFSKNIEARKEKL